MEYCTKGNLSDKIYKRFKSKKTFKESEIWNMFMQIVLALHEVHRHKKGSIIHRGVKPENIFIDSEDNLKLGDFSLAKMMSDEIAFTMTQHGASSYTAPEQLI